MSIPIVGSKLGLEVVPATCRPYELVTGIRARQGLYVDSITGIQCNTVSGIMRGDVPREVGVGTFGTGGGGTNVVRQCPTGYAAVGFNVLAGDWMNGMTLECASIVNPSQRVTLPVVGNNGVPFAKNSGTPGGPQATSGECPPGQWMYVNSVGGRAGTYVNALSGTCRSLSSDPGGGWAATVGSANRQLECCAGLRTGEACSYPYTPSAQVCRDLATRMCAQPQGAGSAYDFFSTPCRTLFAGQGRQVTNQQDDEIARQVCAAIKRDPSATQAERDWCSCYNAEVPVNTPVALRGIFQCVDPVCQAKGLKPFGQTCPSSITICQQEQLTTELSKSQIGRQFIANQCGNINVGGGGGGAGEGGNNNNNTGGGVSVPLVIGGTSLVLLFAGLFIAYVLARRKEKKQ